MLRQIWIDLRVRLTSLFGRRDLHARAREEMEFHLAMRERRLMDLGLPASEARLQARREFGNLSLLQENTIESWRYAALERLLLDTRYAMRRLAKSPGFTLAAAVTLGLGIGATVAIFTLLYQVLIKPFPYPNAEQLVVLWDTSGQFAKSEVTPADFRDWRQQAKVFSEMAAYSYLDNVPLRSIDGAELIDVQRVDENFFKVLGVSPLRGRWFDAQEAQSGSPRVAVISHGFWQRHFSGRENLTGAEVGGYRVVGVMPPGFLFGERNTDLWIPLVISEREWTSRTNDILLVVGRLKPGVSITQANTEMDRITAGLARAYPATNTNRQALLFPLREEFAGSVRTIYFVLFAASGCVLLVACLNVAHLLLLRGARRQRELAVRASLGASRARLTQQLLTESALLAFGGGLIGLIISQWTFSFFATLIPSGMAGISKLDVNWPVLAFTAVVVSVSACLAGLTPALRLSSLQLAGAMQEGGRSGIARRGRVHNGLVVCQISVAVVLLVCSSLFIGTMMRINAVDPGFDISNLLTVQLLIQRPDYYNAVLQRVRALPGVSSAGVSTVRPLTPFPGRRDLTIDGYSRRDPGDQPEALFRTISTGYLETLKVALHRGRMFDEGDRMGSPPVALINESMRRRYWPDRDPIGMRVKLGAVDSKNPWYTIVGVVEDVKQRRLDIAAEPELMVPYLQDSGFYRPRNLILRTTVDPASLVEVVRREVLAVDSSLPVSVMTMEQVASQGLNARRPRTVLMTGFAALSLFLSILGVYALVSFAVVDRRQEIGVRLALGAYPGLVIRKVVREALVLAAIGCGAGLCLAGGLTWTLRSFLYDVTPTDPASFLGAALLMLLVAVVASYVPARRVTKIDPVTTLRYD